MNAHVVESQLRCNACNRRIRTRHAGYFEPMYPFCPWCGEPVTDDAIRLKECKWHDTESEEYGDVSKWYMCECSDAVGESENENA